MVQLSKRQRKIIDCFLNKELCTSQELAKALSLSQRTIRNEVQQLNTLFNTPLLISLKGQGYKMDPVCAQQIEDVSIQHTSDSNSRKFHILKELLSYPSVNYYDLADAFYISESTLDKTILQLNRIIHTRYPDIHIQRNQNELSIQCNENQRRLIYSCFLIHEIQEYDFDIQNYRDFFHSCDVNELKQYIVSFNRTHRLGMRDFEVFSFILHIAVMLERVNKGWEIRNPTQPLEQSSIQLAQAFYQGLHEQFAVTLSSQEQEYLALLFAGKISRITSEKVSDYEAFIEQITKELHEHYDINLSYNEAFKDGLLIHLLGLDARMQNNSFLTNPLIQDTKQHFPLLYDMSVYVALRIQEKFHCSLLEDEIGYITLHLMNAVERIQQKLSKKIILVTSLGKAQNDYLITKLTNCTNRLFIEVVRCLSIFDTSRLQDMKADLIISTLPIRVASSVPIYVCSNFLDDKDIEHILSLLMKEKRNEKQQQLQYQYFDDRLFFHDMEFHNEDEVISFLCEQLKQCGDCGDDFYEKVMEREHIAPTAYGNLFAIPHPVEKCAYHNKVAVCTLKQSILWQGKKVKMVFLFSLTQGHDRNFEDIFEGLVSLLNDIDNVKVLMRQSTLPSFLDVFFSLHQDAM